jgi:hypothetical protein
MPYETVVRLRLGQASIEAKMTGRYTPGSSPFAGSHKIVAIIAAIHGENAITSGAPSVVVKHFT